MPDDDINAGIDRTSFLRDGMRVFLFPQLQSRTAYYSMSGHRKVSIELPL